MGIRTQISNKGIQVKTVWALQSILSQGKSEYQACIRLSANSDESIKIKRNFNTIFIQSPIFYFFTFSFIIFPFLFIHMSNII